MSPESSKTHLVLIPSYNTGDLVLETVKGALAEWAPVWVVVDGSDDGSGEKLEALADSEPNLRVLRLAKNHGKGAAVYHGSQQAAAEGFTHMLCMDADGQHPAAMIRTYMAASRAQPDRMILGRPVFPENAPKARVYGRRLANFWVHVFTLWEGVGDCLFGMRVYPVVPFNRVMKRTNWGRRYDFDPEVTMRLCWDGVRTKNLDTPVRYLTKEEGGVSHFHYLRDNVLLTWMYYRLFPGYLLRLPALVAQKRRHRIEDKLSDPDSDASIQRARLRISRRYEWPWDQHYASMKLKTDPVYEAVFDEIDSAGTPDLPVLDIGCGPGLLSFYLRERGWKAPILGIDFDQRKIGMANWQASRFYEDLEFRQCDVRDGVPEFRGHVAVLDILQYFSPEQQEAILRAAAKSVAPGGVLVIRNCLADKTWRFRLTRFCDAFSFFIRWMKSYINSYPTERRIRAVLEVEGLEGEFRPLWGSTPFNSWLIVYRRSPEALAEVTGLPSASNRSVEGMTQVNPAS
ncbi:MAG: glycosyltransferase [Verrucomicrobiae bacterium]|nr:glycosyltransferase [Verrucomicrobiae bacterium]